MTKLAIILLATITAAALLAGCDPAGGYLGYPPPRVYTPIPRDKAAYDLVHSHHCGEHYMAAGQMWNSFEHKLEQKPASDAYYCEDIGGVIFVEEAQP